MPEVMPPVTLMIRASTWPSIWLWCRSGGVPVSMLITPFRSSPSRGRRREGLERHTVDHQYATRRLGRCRHKVQGCAARTPESAEHVSGIAPVRGPCRPAGCNLVDDQRPQTRFGEQREARLCPARPCRPRRLRGTNGKDPAVNARLVGPEHHLHGDDRREPSAGLVEARCVITVLNLSMIIVLPMPLSPTMSSSACEHVGRRRRRFQLLQGGLAQLDRDPAVRRRSGECAPQALTHSDLCTLPDRDAGGLMILVPLLDLEAGVAEGRAPLSVRRRQGISRCGVRCYIDHRQMQPPSLMAPYPFRLPLGAVDEVALRLDRPENQLPHLPTGARPRARRAAPRGAPERDRRPCGLRGSRFGWSPFSVGAEVRGWRAGRI